MYNVYRNIPNMSVFLSRAQDHCPSVPPFPCWVYRCLNLLLPTVHITGGSAFCEYNVQGSHSLTLKPGKVGRHFPVREK